MTVLAPDTRLVLVPDAYNNPTCPIWDGLKSRDPRYSLKQNILAEGSRYYSSRAGGPFLLMPSGAPLLERLDDEQKSLTVGQKANLSYWIYQHNLDSRLLDELSSQDLQEPGRFARWMNDHRDRVLKLDKAWVEGHRDRKPSFLDRELTYLSELFRSNDADEQPNEDLLQAAAGCRNARDLAELRQHTVDQGWMGSNKPGSEGTSPYQINASARKYVEEQLGEQGAREQVPGVDAPDGSAFDVFICHTTDDKDDVARPLAEALRDAGLNVWYDEFELKIGHRLRHKIDKGLAASRFGVVVLSPAFFFGRRWTEYELDGLVAKMVPGEQVLLPVWHNVTGQEVMEYSPSLVDLVALSTATHTVEAIAAEIVDVIRNTPESVDAVQRQGHIIQALNHDMANSHDSNLLCSSEEKALLLVMHETGSVPPKDLMGPVADGLEDLGLIKRHYGADGGIYGTITGKGSAYIRVWEEEDSNGAEPPH